MNISSKVLYLGPWDHVEVTKDFPRANEFIFIDTQPRSEWDDLNFHSSFYKNNFVSNIIKKFKKYGFTPCSMVELDSRYYMKVLNCIQCMYYNFMCKFPVINPTLMTFINKKTNQSLRYYMSTNIETNMCPILEFDIKTADSLIVSGYFPSMHLLKYFYKPKKFIGYSKTCWNTNNDTENTIIEVLRKGIKNNTNSRYFSNYTFVNNNMKTILPNFDSFINLYNKI
jgi:hypothetical protein